MSLQNRVILFFFITSLGSALSSIASFLSIEHYFQSLIFLGIALSLRTLASAIFSYFSNYIIYKLGITKSLWASQAFGCLALIVLYLGFYFNHYLLTIMGIILTGLPSTFVSILLTIILRISAENSELFRKYSGKRELVFGTAMLLSSLTAPFLLWKFNLYFVFLIDSISYIAGLMLLLNLKFSTFNLNSEEDKQSHQLIKLCFISTNARKFMIKTSASLLLAGLLPLLASSEHIQLTMHMPTLIRQWLWSIEDITAIIASALYVFFGIIRKYKFIDVFAILSGLFLFIPIFFQTNYSIIVAIITICLLTDFSGQKFRDDLIVSAGNNTNLIKSYSALSLFQKNFIFFMSPILLSILFTYSNNLISICIILAIQVCLYVIFRMFFRRVITQQVIFVSQL